MRFHVLTSLLALASTTSAAITWNLQKAANPTTDQADAYSKIEAAMKLAVARYARFSDATKSLTIQYEPSVATADGNYNGNIRFGSNRSYMTERTAMHEISHTLGIGQTAAFDTKCAANDWATATPLLRSWDGANAKINCGGGHIWPYGLNFAPRARPYKALLSKSWRTAQPYESEWSTTNADRHVQLIDAMLADGL